MVQFILSRVLGLFSRTWRFRLEGAARDEALLHAITIGEEIGVIMFLHGDMIPAWTFSAGSKGVPVVSSSRDGTRLVEYLEHALGFGRFIRGSSSSDGGGVLHQMLEVLRKDSVLITPDGPRGPSGVLKAGGVVASQRTGRLILLIAPESKRAIRFSSWDSMRIPLPWSNINIRYCILHPPADKTDISTVIRKATAWFSSNSMVMRSDA